MGEKKSAGERGAGGLAAGMPCQEKAVHVVSYDEMRRATLGPVAYAATTPLHLLPEKERDRERLREARRAGGAAAGDAGKAGVCNECGQGGVAGKVGAEGRLLCMHAECMYACIYACMHAYMQTYIHT